MRIIYDCFHKLEKMPLTKIQQKSTKTLIDEFFDFQNDQSKYFGFKYEYLEKDEIIEDYFDNILIHYNDRDCHAQEMDDWVVDLYKEFMTNNKPPEFINIAKVK